MVLWGLVGKWTDLVPGALGVSREWTDLVQGALGVSREWTDLVQGALGVGGGVSWLGEATFLAQ